MDFSDVLRYITALVGGNEKTMSNYRFVLQSMLGICTHFVDKEDDCLSPTRLTYASAVLSLLVFCLSIFLSLSLCLFPLRSAIIIICSALDTSILSSLD